MLAFNTCVLISLGFHFVKPYPRCGNSTSAGNHDYNNSLQTSTMRSKIEIKTIPRTAKCRLDISGVDWKDFSSKQHKDMTRIIQIHLRMRNSVEHNWYWAKSSQEPFLRFFALFNRIYDFTSNLLLQASHLIIHEYYGLTDFPQGCFDNITIYQQTRFVAHAFSLNQTSEHIGAICHLSSTDWTLTMNRRIFLYCCRTADPKSSTQCDRGTIQNTWLGIVNIFLVVMFVLSALFAPALFFFVRRPFDYSSTGIKLVRPDSPVNPVTMYSWRAICYLWPVGDSNCSKAVRILNTFTVPLIIFLISYWVRLTPLNDSVLFENMIKNDGTFYQIIRYFGIYWQSLLLGIFRSFDPRRNPGILRQSGLDFERVKCFLNPHKNIGRILSVLLPEIATSWWKSTLIIKLPVTYLRNSWEDFPSTLLSVIKLPLLSLIVFLSVFVFIIWFIVLGTFELIIILLTIPSGFLLSFPLVNIISFASYQLMNDLPVFNRFMQTNWGKKKLMMLLIISVYCTYLVLVVFILVFAVMSLAGQAAYTFIGILLFLHDLLPYITFLLITLIFLWNHYKFITCKYQTLRCLLIKSGIQFDQILRRNNHTAQLIYFDSSGAPRIPETLYRTVCQEMLPVKKALVEFLVKIVCTSLFFFFMFACIMTFGSTQSQGSTITPLVQSIATLLIGTLPKLTSLCARDGTVDELKGIQMKKCIDRIILQFIVGQRQDANRHQENHLQQETASPLAPEPESRPEETPDRNEYERIPWPYEIIKNEFFC